MPHPKKTHSGPLRKPLPWAWLTAMAGGGGACRPGAAPAGGHGHVGRPGPGAAPAGGHGHVGRPGPGAAPGAAGAGPAYRPGPGAAGGHGLSVFSKRLPLTAYLFPKSESENGNRFQNTETSCRNLFPKRNTETVFRTRKRKRKPLPIFLCPPTAEVVQQQILCCI